MLLIKEIKSHQEIDEKGLARLVERKLRCKINSLQIQRKAIDARDGLLYVHNVLVEVDNEDKYLGKNVSIYIPRDLSVEHLDRNKTCIIVGYGPAGIFSAYRLSEAGYRVLVFEKGKRIKERAKDVEAFFNGGKLNPKSNVQYGEGGAGTFSDAKLTTRIKDDFVEYILKVFVEHGAKKSIMYENHPHIGTDKIRDIIANMTDDLMNRGVEFHFEEEAEDIVIDENRNVRGIKTSLGEYPCDHLLLGMGHSAYESVEMLRSHGVYIEDKDIAIGFRVEHPQDFIDMNQTSGMVKEANEYFLRYKDEKGVYSFCMCPGGIVVPAMSDVGTIVTNGMSYADRSSGIANSAILIQIRKDEFDDGYRYLKSIEEKAYAYSDSYRALSQNIKDFMEGKLDELIFESSYPLKTVLYDFNNFFKPSDLEIIKRAFRHFDRKIPGFIDNGIMVGPETRSSCPIRITRNEDFESINTGNLFPMGEGSGYGGGIMSCALDGIRVANKIISNYGKVSAE